MPHAIGTTPMAASERRRGRRAGHPSRSVEARLALGQMRFQERHLVGGEGCRMPSAPRRCGSNAWRGRRAGHPSQEARLALGQMRFQERHLVGEDVAVRQDQVLDPAGGTAPRAVACPPVAACARPCANCSGSTRRRRFPNGRDRPARSASRGRGSGAGGGIRVRNTGTGAGRGRTARRWSAPAWDRGRAAAHARARR